MLATTGRSASRFCAREKHPESRACPRLPIIGTSARNGSPIRDWREISPSPNAKVRPGASARLSTDRRNTCAFIVGSSWGCHFVTALYHQACGQGGKYCTLKSSLLLEISWHTYFHLFLCHRCPFPGPMPSFQCAGFFASVATMQTTPVRWGLPIKPMVANHRSFS